MSLTSTYSARVRKLLVVVLVLVFTSGFIVVQNSCPMERGSACAAVCSGGSMNDTAPSSGMSVRRATPDCCKASASVDRKSFTAVFENHQKTDDLKVICPLLAAGIASGFSPATPMHHAASGIALSASPPTAEKYILHASLLI